MPWIPCESGPPDPRFFFSSIVGGKWSVSSPCRLNPGDTALWHPLYKRLYGPQSKNGSYGKENNLFLLLGTELLLSIPYLLYQCLLLRENNIIYTVKLYVNSLYPLDIKTKKDLTSWPESVSELYRATAACRRSYCQLLRIEDVTWSAWRIPTAVFSVFWTGAATFSFK
jgi:hypothetical protein